MIITPHRFGHRSILALCLAATCAILIFDRGIFWRPFVLSQESNASLKIFSYTLGNDVSARPNPFLSRAVYLESQAPVFNRHYPNAFMWVFAHIFRWFGRSELVARTATLLIFLAAAILLTVPFGKRYPLVYAAIPFVFLSSNGRDSIPFISWDSILNLLIAVAFFAVSQIRALPKLRHLFRAIILVAPLFVQTAAAFLFFFIVVDYALRRDRRDFILHIALLGFSTLFIIGALVYGPDGDWQAGIADLHSTILRRSIVMDLPAGEVVPWWRFFRGLAGKFYDNVGMGIAGPLLVAAAWYTTVVKKEWWIAALLPSFFAYDLVFRGTVAGHIYSYLPWVFFGFLTLFVGVVHWVAMAPTLFELDIVSRIREKLARTKIVPGRTAVVMGALLLWGIGIRAVPQEYSFRESVYLVKSRAAMHALLADQDVATRIRELGCNGFAFQFVDQDYHILPAFAAASPWADIVVGRLRSGDPMRLCSISVETHQVSLLDTGAESITN